MWFVYAQTTMYFSEMRWIDAVVQWLRHLVNKVRFRKELLSGVQPPGRFRKKTNKNTMSPP